MILMKTGMHYEPAAIYLVCVLYGPSRRSARQTSAVRTEPTKGSFGSKAAVVRHRPSIARPSHRACVVSQRLCVGRRLPSQIMCAGNGHLLRVGPFIIARGYM
jgi:hypothetical protein